MVLMINYYCRRLLERIQISLIRTDEGPVLCLYVDVINVVIEYSRKINHIFDTFSNKTIHVQFGKNKNKNLI